MFSPILRQSMGTLRTTIGTTVSQIPRIIPRPLSLLLHPPPFPRHPILPRLPITQQTRPAHGRPSNRGPRYSYQRFQSRSRSLHYLWKHSRKFRIIVFLSAAGLGAFYINNIETVPVSGRRRFNVFSPEFEVQMAKAMYESTMKEFRNNILPANHPYTRMVRRVMERLVRVSGMEDLNWEVYVIKDDAQKNAFVIPGGKVFVFSGILPIAANDDGLAAVLSHEISHTIAHHTAERMSQMFLMVAALWATSLLLGSGGDGGLGRILMDLVYLRPQSRKQESEADYIGLMMLAQACYNPEEAPRLWQRMSVADKTSPPQFLSTHPAHATRVENFEKWMPEALDIQAQTDCYQTADAAEQFRRHFGGGSIW